MPSIVVTARVPTAAIGRRHERTGLPSTWTVQAPHWAMPQPYLVPVIPSTSRNTQRRGVSPATSTLCFVPLTLIEKVITLSRLEDHQYSITNIHFMTKLELPNP